MDANNGLSLCIWCPVPCCLSNLCMLCPQIEQAALQRQKLPAWCGVGAFLVSKICMATYPQRAQKSLHGQEQ
eukprot:1157507-Pelagomonas_calceolata.AAC.2